MRWQPTDEMVEAGAAAFWGENTSMQVRRSESGKRRDTERWRAALIAAHAVQPPVDVLRERLCICGGSGMSMPGGGLCATCDGMGVVPSELDEALDTFAREVEALSDPDGGIDTSRYRDARDRLIDLYRERGL